MNKLLQGMTIIPSGYNKALEICSQQFLKISLELLFELNV